jgi:hypothetical protein
MRNNASCAITSFLFAITLASSAPAEPLEFTGFGLLRDIGCGENTAIVEGMRHGLNFTGHCVQLSVSGMENEVDFETAATVSLIGADNQMQGALAGPAIPGAVDVLLSGTGNTLTLRFDRPAIVEITGSGNKLVWGVAPGIPAPDIRISGENNSVEAP